MKTRVTPTTSLQKHWSATDLPGEVHVDLAYETAQVRFDKYDTVLKFNKVDQRFRVHTPSTSRARSFVARNPWLPFPDMSLPNEELSLFGAYRLNQSGTELLDVTATCQHGDEVVWRTDIPEPPADSRFSMIKPKTPKAGPSIIDIDERRQAEGE